MKDQRPKNLNLLTIRQPLPAIASILHRISGIILFLAIPLVIWVFNLSLQSADNFDAAQQLFKTPVAKLMTLAILAPFIYHFVAGIRHLLLDINIGITLKGGQFSALLTLIISIVLILLAGIWIW